MENNYLDINRASWNNRLDAHLSSDFYDVAGFLKGKTSLNEIELGLLGDVSGKRILHLQCHFGQDTLSLGRMGADVTGVDLSDKAIDKARALSEQTGVAAEFICCDVYDLPAYLDKAFDIVFTSYGTIGWLPDMEKWAGVVAHFLKPGGRFVFVEFHPVVWMFDDDFEKVGYPYFNRGAIVEAEEGTYADREAAINQSYVMWNHGMGEVVSSLTGKGIRIHSLTEYDYSPYNCFRHTVAFSPGKYRIRHMGDKLPMVYAIVGER
ncbi:class I SAM-dependent methyltransferase [Roseivirga sp. BDSF3-8]|uniref:class I SAM-dependent methyltransferase n=1 Tax=Roseivirga sp. BDSF3-8 TaxID=3241598 RepID=UPI00353274D4